MISVGRPIVLTFPSESSRNDMSEDERVEALIARLVDAWNEGALDRFLACFSADADYVTTEGIHGRGTEAIRELLGERIGSKLEPIEVHDLDIRELNDEICLARASWSSPKGRAGIFTVVIRSTSEPRILALQNTPLSRRLAEEKPN